MNLAPASKMDPIRFEEVYFQRIWGGERLKNTLGKKTPQDAITGEAWLISDHPHCESRAADGPHQGKTLHELLALNASAILGKRAQLTPHGRFPLLLKLIDTGDILSVQVHPNDEDAQRLGESDSGKTEMWHVLDADPGAELFCGLSPNTSPDAFQQALANHRLTECITRFPAPAGTNVFVPAGTVHAIGKDILLAEIQQNSDLTYRVYDWDRVDASGTPRPLHIDKAMAVIRFDAGHNGPSQPLAYELNGASCSVLAACRYFAAELLAVTDSFTRTLTQDSFHLLLVKNGPLTVQGTATEYTLKAGEAILIPGSSNAYTIHGSGAFLDYYVPDLSRNIADPLLRAGHSKESIQHLGEKQELTHT